MGTATEELWSFGEDEMMRRLYRRMPRRELAALLGRTEAAVQIRGKVLGLRPWRHRPGVLCADEVAALLGIGRRALDGGRKWEALPWRTYYEGNVAVRFCEAKALRRWLSEPLNVALVGDVERMPAGPWKRLARRTQQRSPYMTPDEAAARAHFCVTAIRAMLERGALDGVRRERRWFVHEQEVERLCQDW